jgi:molybdopterin-synthase adenylyltransferase
MDLTESQIQRYSRHILLPEIGGVGQERLLAARVLVVGAGGLGAPLLLYLAAAGIGTLGFVDHDHVDLSNLQRQIIHDTASLGRPKVDSAAARIAALNPDVRIEAHACRLTVDNALDLVRAYDVIADGTDSFATRYLLNDACVLAGKPLVSAALLRFDGQLSTFAAHRPGCPCYRCLFPEAPPPGMVPSCSQAGILGALAGTLGCMQATEVVKEVLGIGESLAGTLVLYDGLAARMDRFTIPKDPDCAMCGAAARWHDLQHHRAGSGA